MCGILAAFGLTGDAEKNRRQLLRLSKLLRHRGPDANALWTDGTNWIAHERLTIIDVSDAGRCGARRSREQQQLTPRDRLFRAAGGACRRAASFKMLV
jgi:asparagine synthetase B (glutamine-hydrolysing)